jgi:hypothetical protein
MAVDLSADLNKRKSLTARRNLVAFFAFAVSIAAPFTPASAVVPAAPAWAQSAEINQMVIKVETWERQRARRQGRSGGRILSCAYRTRGDCEAHGHCKWQKGTVLHPGEGYCYHSAPGVAKPALGHKPQ